ncbi:MAG: tRNA(His) guanylyltransferase Thg1 family protein [Clostridia bacterium]|nr:tRNA(His) guanylyltransferase Thg1 family protein [Clostridia bacterium]
MSKQKKITQVDYLKAVEPFEFFIRETDLRVKTDEYIILHFDGVGMTKKYLSHMNRSDKKIFSECLLKTAQVLCSYFKSTRLAYACNDEISLLLAGQDIIDNYHNRIQKLVSIAAAKASTELLQHLQRNEKIAILKELQDNCLFAVKCYNLPQNLVNNYFRARLLSCKKTIYDHREKFEDKEPWEQFGYLITYHAPNWQSENVDFSELKLVKKPQDEYYSIKKDKQ